MTSEERQPTGGRGVRAVDEDLLWRAITDSTRGRFEIIAEIARDADGAAAFVGRPPTGGDLVILKLEPEGRTATGERRYELFELKELDETVPAPRTKCPVCAASVAMWRGRCPACGSPVGDAKAGMAGLHGAPLSSDVLLAFYQFVSGGYDVIGELEQPGEGPPVYVVRRRDESELLALRLALGGTASSGQVTYVVDVLPLRTAGGAEAAPSSRMPLAVSDPTAVIEAVATTTAAERVCPQCGSLFGAGTLFCPKDGASLRPLTQSGDLVGQLIDDRYYVESRLGEGGMGEVYAAHQVRTGRKCAIKLMHRTLTQDADAVGRFRREAASACSISHANVATIYDSGETSDGRPYFAMEFVDGRSLSKVISEEGPLNALRTAEIARQVAEGLSAAHALGIVHRDLKPENVMLGVSRDGIEFVKLVDFGIAKPTNTGASNTITKTGFILGTPAYMSPEQVCADKVDGRTDLYSLGCVMHEMLTGATPFAGQSLEMVMMKRLSDPPPRPRATNPDIPEVLDDVVVKLLAREADERYQSARELADALFAAEAGLEGSETGAAVRVRAAAQRVARTPSSAISGPQGPVVVTPGARPPRKSRDVAPPAPRSPAVAMPSPAFGVPVVTDEQTNETLVVPGATRPSTKGGAKSRRLIVGGVAAVVLVAGGAMALRLARGGGARAGDGSASSRPTDVPVTQAPSAPASPAPGTGQPPSSGQTGTLAQPPKPDTPTIAASKGAAQVTNSRTPAKAQDQAPAGRATQAGEGDQRSKQAPVTVAPPPVVNPNPVTPTNTPAPPTSRDTRSESAAVVRADTKATAEEVVAATTNAEKAKVRDVIETYVRGIGDKRPDLLLRAYPAMTEQSQAGFQALFRNASDLATELIGTPTITLRGTNAADADFVYELRGHDPQRGNFTQRSSVRAKLQKSGQGVWTIQSLAAGAQ